MSPNQSAPGGDGPGWVALVIMTAAGLVAGGASWWGIQQFGETFGLPEDAQSIMNRMANPSAPESAIIQSGRLTQAYKNTALSGGILGMTAAGFAGLAAGALRKSGLWAATRALAGLVTGKILGAAGGLTGVFLSQVIAAHPNSSSQAMAMHAAVFTLVGVAAGLAACGSLRRLRDSSRAVFAAAAAGLVAALIYPLLAGTFFPLDHAERVIPRGVGSLLLWTELPCTLIGIALGRAGVGGSQVGAADPVGLPATP